MLCAAGCVIVSYCDVLSDDGVCRVDCVSYDETSVKQCGATFSTSLQLNFVYP